MEQTTELKSETTKEPDYNQSEIAHRQDQDYRKHRTKDDHRQWDTMYISGHNQSEISNGATGNLVNSENETSHKSLDEEEAIFAVFEEQDKRQIRMETICEHLNSNILQKLVLLTRVFLLITTLTV